MKRVRMLRDFSFQPQRRVVVHYRAGKTYRRVPEAAARAILAAGAGEVVDGAAAPHAGQGDQVAASPFTEVNRERP